MSGSLIVLVETLKDCTTKPTISCTQENLPLKEVRERDCFLSGNRKQFGSRQIRGFSTEHGGVSTNICYIEEFVK